VSIPSHYPERPRRALERLIEDLAPFAPEPHALVVYGSLARGTFREGESDVNLALVLGDTSLELLGRLHAPLRGAWRAMRIEPFIVRVSEIPRLAEAFPIKLLDIKTRSDAILGENPFRDVEIRPAELQRRIAQELRNHVLRLRRRYAMSGAEPVELARALFGSDTSVLVELDALLRLTGTPPADDSAEAIFAESAKRFGIDGAVLGRLHAFKKGAEDRDIASLYRGLLSSLERALEVVDGLEVAP
jgi:predicted nucleotidyltransferase